MRNWLRGLVKLPPGIDTPLQVFSFKPNASIGGLGTASRCQIQNLKKFLLQNPKRSAMIDSDNTTTERVAQNFALKERRVGG